MFEITSITDSLTAVVEIKHPISGVGIGATVTLAGPENPVRKAIDFAKQRRLRASIQKTGKIEFSDPADDELDLIDKLASCTLDWSGIMDSGNAVPFSKAAASKLYATDGLGWLRNQLATALDERERFITASALTS